MGIETFDLEAVASKYAGVNRIRHLQFIVECGKNAQSAFEVDSKRVLVLQLAKDALRMLLADLETSKTTVNTSLYRDLTTKFKDLLPLDFEVNAPFLENAQRANAVRHERLEQELNSYKSSLIKESIRIGHNDLGEFYYRVGELPNALRSFIQARDYCTTEKHIVDMCFNVIRASVHLKNFSNVSNYLVKLEQSIASSESDSILSSQVAATFGLVHFCNKKYHAAALKFVDCHIDLGAQYNEVLHAEDVALLGGLCALATFSRADLKDRVIQNSSFKAFLELVPRLRELISDFYSGNYASCLHVLNDMKEELLLDLYLSTHVADLVKEIRHRAIVQYFNPYLSVDMKLMATAFNTTPVLLEDELRELILANKLLARIDSHNMILFAHQADQRAATYKNAIEMGRKYSADTKSLMLRMHLLKHNIVVGSNSAKAGHHPRDIWCWQLTVATVSIQHTATMDATGEGTDERGGNLHLFDAVQKELAQHTTAIRVVLTHLAARIVALEHRVDEKSGAISTMDSMLHAMATQLHKLDGSFSALGEPVAEMLCNMESLTESYVKLDQTTAAHANLLGRQADDLLTLNTKLEESAKKAVTTTRQEIEVLVHKTDSMHDKVLQKIEETKSDLTTKLDDVSKKVEGLDESIHEIKEKEPPPPPPPLELPTGTGKVPVQVHSRRLEASKPKAKGPYTDLKQFRIPDEMHDRLEHNIAALYSDEPRPSSKGSIRPSPNDNNNPAESAPKPKTPQPASFLSRSRRSSDESTMEKETFTNLLSFVRMRSQDDSMGGLTDMRNQLQKSFHAMRAMVDATRVEARSKQDALHVVLDREVAALKQKMKHLRDQMHQLMPLGHPQVSAHALLASDGEVDDDGNSYDLVELPLGSLPTLRIALLELSRNLHIVRQNKKHLSPDMRRNLDKIVTVLNEAYQAMSSEDVDATTATKHTERVARALAFGIHATIDVLTTVDLVSTKELKNTLEHVSTSLTSRLQGDDERDGLKAMVQALRQEVLQAKSAQEGAIHVLETRIDEVKQRGVASLGEKHGHSRVDLHDRGKLLASVEHDLQQMKQHLHTRDAVVQKLSAELEHTTRLVARYLPSHDSPNPATSPKQQKRIPQPSHKRVALQALNPSSISSPSFTKQASLSSLCVENSAKQSTVGRRTPLAPWTPPQTPPQQQQPPDSA
ncbi:Aste57867_20921 [Aphanomyces stellatus]|uniref:Aste57867_20921 protein n=1 Tax=Aphanomyces stellatus TaxID=120398 RepID=A0A485LKW2_9STRA|nr:hypothetical protein As57867_020853 [Aphanomyces stellatus]VFT97598.1 Aste57867_20921 [Aphanomyces stellatus]